MKLGDRLYTIHDAVENAIGFLKSPGAMNSDGGIAATKPGDASGCWTTAETLEIFVETESLFHLGLKQEIEKMASFLLENQQKDGSWKLTYANHTVTCGCAVEALTILLRVVQQEDLREKAIDAAKRGIEWLKKHQNDDGGWGPDPTGGGDGSRSRVISTSVALQAFFSKGERDSNSVFIRKAIEYLEEIQNDDGGWGPISSEKSDPCNTARALQSLVRSHKYSAKDAIIAKGWRYIFRERFRTIKTAKNIARNSPSSGWESTMETFLIGHGYSGRVFLYNNTIYEVMCCSLLLGHINKNILDCLRHYLLEQQEDGSWHFNGEETCTWPTNQGLHILNLSSRILKQGTLVKKQRNRKYVLLLVLVGILGFSSVAQYLLYSGFLGQLGEWWLSLPSEIRSLIVVGVGLGVAVGVISELIHDAIKKMLTRAFKKDKE